MRAQHQPRIFFPNVKRVLHLTGRMILAEVQRVEVEPFGFQLGAFSDFPSHSHKHIRDSFSDGSDWVARTTWNAIPGQGDVYSLITQNLVITLDLQLSPTSVECAVDDL